MNATMKKLSLLLLCLPSSMMISLLSSSMLYIQQEYAAYSESVVTMILTIPNLTVILGLILVPMLVKKFPIKHLILAGLGIFVIASVLPVWCDSFYLILCLRALSGIRCGMIMPLMATFMAAYPEKERAALMGLSSTVGCLVSAAIVSVSGLIAAVNWRYIFYLYLINIIVMVMVVLFLPKNLAQLGQSAPQQTTASVGITRQQGGYGKVLFLYYFLMVGGYICIAVVAAVLAPYLANIQMGGSAESGVLMSMFMLGGVVSGLVFKKYISALKDFAMPMIFAGAAVGFVLLWQARALVVIGAAILLLGAFSTTIANVVNYELSRELPLALFTTASAVSSFFVYILQFAAPMVFFAVVGLIPTGSFRTVFLIYAIVQAAFMGIALILPKVLLERK